MQYCITSNGDVIAAEMGDPDSPFSVPPEDTARPQKQGEIDFIVTFNDVRNNTNRGFDDPATGSARRAVVNRVLSYVNSVLDESGAVNILFEQSITSTGTNFLATAGPLFLDEDGFTNGFPFERITRGVDPNGGDQAELFARVNFALNWYTGTGQPGDEEFDLFSVLLHEITHGLGMLSFADPDGTGSAVNPKTYSVFDSYLASIRSDLFVDLREPTFLGTEQQLTSGAVFFSGPASARSLGRAPRIYAPNPFANGSSLSHFDPSLGEDILMAPSISRGETLRRYTPFELAAMSDLGYRLEAVQVCRDGDEAPIKAAYLSGGEKAIFGEDDRMDVRGLSAQNPLQRVVKATCAVIEAQRLVPDGEDAFDLETSPYLPNGRRVCADEPFANQRVAALCSGVLVQPDVVAVAGSCLEFRELEELRFVFRFALNDDGTMPESFSADEVYEGLELIATEYDSGQLNPTGINYAVIRLDRPVPDVLPVEIRLAGEIEPFTPLGIVGHPSGLPTKIAVGRRGAGNSVTFAMQAVANCTMDSFLSNVDGYAGGFGGPVFNPETLLVEGLFASGVPDFISVPGEGCQLSRVYPNFAGAQLSTKTTAFATYLPPEMDTLALLTLNRPSYVCGETIGLRLADLNAMAGAAPEVMTISMDAEGTVVDEEFTPLEMERAGVFLGEVATSLEATETGDGQLSVVDGGRIVAMTEDPDDGTGAAMVVMDEAEAICRPVLEVSPASIDFGKVFAGETREVTLRVANRGAGIARGSVSAFAPFAIVSGGDLELPAGAAPHEIEIAFMPSTSGVFERDVVLVANEAVSVAVGGSAFPQVTGMENPGVSGCAAGAGNGHGSDEGLIIAVAVGLFAFGRRHGAGRAV